MILQIGLFGPAGILPATSGHVPAKSLRRNGKISGNYWRSCSFCL